MKILSKPYILLFFIILLGAFFRFYNLNWDSGTNQHPDERAIILFTLPLEYPKSFSEFLSPQSPWNPHFFAYGNLPIYLLKFAGNFASEFNPQLAQYDGIQLVGRTISVLADLLVILLIFRIGRLLFNDKIGLVGAFLYAISVFPIQASHFYAVDILLTLFITLTLYRLLKFYKKPTPINAALVGIIFGLALVTKISAITLLVAIGVALVSDFVFIFLRSPHKPKHWFPHIPRLIKKLLTDGLIIILTTCFTFILLQPYALIDSQEFILQNIQQSQMTHNAYTFPYTLQYVDKVPYIYEIKNIFLWGQGPLIAILCTLGILLFLIKIKQLNKVRIDESSIILSFLLIYFLVVGSFAIGFMRYMLPIYPILSLFGGFFIVNYLLKFLLGLKSQFLRALSLFIFLILLMLWPLSFLSIYKNENTRIAASNWINNNIPQGSTLTHEVWDDQLPLYTAGNYKTQDLGLYDQPDDSTKWDKLNSQINDSDYIIIASNRLYTPIQKLSDCSKYKICFPKASVFYKNLFEDKLKFKKVAEFSSFPTIPFLNIAIDDTTADEAFTVYDHPRVLIYKKVR